MSNYTPIVLYGPKDSLPLNDANKFIKGVQIDAELTAIATAIATKLDAPVVGLSASGNANAYAITAAGNAATGQSFGLDVVAGTNNSDISLLVTSKSGSVYFKVRGDGAILGGSNQVDMTPNSGSFNGTFTGFSSSVIVPVFWHRIGRIATLLFPSGAHGTSNSTSFTMTGLPVEITPVTTSFNAPIDVAAVQNNGGTPPSVGAVFTASSGTIAFHANGSTTNWVASGTKGFVSTAVVTYLL